MAGCVFAGVDALVIGVLLEHEVKFGKMAVSFDQGAFMFVFIFLLRGMGWLAFIKLSVFLEGTAPQ